MIRTIIQDHLDDPRLTWLTATQRAALIDIAACGTTACGVHAELCDHCGDRRKMPNTCGNRSCPHCQGAARAAWVAAREAELLPCSYFQVVMTLPAGLRGLGAAFPAVVNDVLLRASGDAVHHLAADPRHLGAEVGSLAVLHTWGSDLRLHLHAHLIVTAGGWDEKGQRWVPARICGDEQRPFLVRVDVLRIAFRRRFTRLLLEAYEDGRFDDGPHEAFPCLAHQQALRAFLGHLGEETWVVYIDRPLGSPQALLRYLGRYVNRVAISPQRITAYDIDQDTVSFQWKDYASGGIQETLTLPAIDFIKRFVQHIPPPRFVRIRFRGLWCTAHRTTKLLRVQAHLRTHPTTTMAPPQPAPERPPSPHQQCQVCGIGVYQRLPGGIRPGRAERRTLIRVLIASRATPVPVLEDALV